MKFTPAQSALGAKFSLLMTLLALLLELLLGLKALIATTLIVGAIAVAACFFEFIFFMITRWWTGESRIVRRIFEHVDDHLGIGKYEARRATRRKRVFDALTGRWGAVIRPSVSQGTIQLTRKHFYIRVFFIGDRAPFKKWRIWQVNTVELRWTSEAFVTAHSFFPVLEQRLAQGLARPYVSGMFTEARDFGRDRVLYTLRDYTDVPQILSAEEELNGREPGQAGEGALPAVEPADR